MNKEKEQKCAVCHHQFSSSNLAWIISFCGHNICNKCLKHSISNKVQHISCSQCKQKYDVDKQTLQEFPKNITILKKLKDSKINSSTISSSNEEKIQQIGQIQSSLLLSQTSVRSISNCPKHGKPLQIICTIDRGLLCAHCAIFGDHHNHTFKTIQQFEGQLVQLKQAYKQIQFKKQICEQSIRGKKYRSSIVAKISDKKDKLVIEIKDKFAKLISLIKDAQSKLYDQLIKCFRVVDAQISKITKAEHTIQKYFNEWKMKTFQYIKSIQQSNDLKDKINIFYRRNKPNISDGRSYLKEIQESNELVRNSIQQKINSIKVQFSPGIDGYIYNYGKVSLNLNQIKGKSITNILSSMQIQQIKPLKKQMKIQFVKSDVLAQTKIQENPKLQQSTPSKKEQLVKTTRGAIGLHKVKSNPKLPKAVFDKMQTPKKPLTPPKHLRKQQVVDHKKQQNLQFAERMLHQFINSSDTLDITGCQLNDEQILHIVKSAAEQKPIKCIKMAKNKLTNAGLLHIIDYLHNATNINLSHNQLTDESIDVIISNRQYMPCLRIVNLAHNKLTQRKIKPKLQQLKRVGIITTL